MGHVTKLLLNWLYRAQYLSQACVKFDGKLLGNEFQIKVLSDTNDEINSTLQWHSLVHFPSLFIGNRRKRLGQSNRIAWRETSITWKSLIQS